MDINYKNYYRDSDYQKFDQMFRNIFMKRFMLIEKFIKKGRILEIGCSNGVFLDLFKDAGWETWGVEPSKNGKIAAEKGHKIIKSYFEKSYLPRSYFDLVVMNHTLEHMENPLKVLKKVHNVLKLDGIIFIDVPNAGGLLAKIMGERWPYLLPEEHKWQFTKESLSELFKDTGFEILRWESRSGIFEYAEPFKEIGRKRFWLEVFALPFSAIATLFNMGDSMSIIGRKQ